MADGHANLLEVPSRSGRVLAVEISGARNGVPVFLLHGTPGSRTGPKPRSSVLYRLGVCLVSYDRPGYGGSSRQVGRTVADAAADVEDIAEALHLGHISVVGRSGGGPHALACAALLGERVARTAVLVSLAPIDAHQFDWRAGMVSSNVTDYSSATDKSAVIESLRIRADDVRNDPESLIELIREEMTDVDRRIVDDVTIRRLLTATYREALRTGPDGWIDDVLALRGAWQFSLGDIRTPVRLWHGTQDNFSPVSHTQWLAKRIPHAEAILDQRAAHFGALEVLPGLLPWLTGWSLTEIKAARAAPAI